MKVILSVNALSGLQEVGDFIARDNVEAAAAAAFVARLKSRCLDLGPFPAAGRKRDEIRLGYRSVTEGDYVIIYRLRPDAVEILHILHGKRDLAKISFPD